MCINDANKDIVSTKYNKVLVKSQNDVNFFLGLMRKIFAVFGLHTIYSLGSMFDVSNIREK